MMGTPEIVCKIISGKVVTGGGGILLLPPLPPLPGRLLLPLLLQLLSMLMVYI